MRGIVLFAHGARDPEWARPFEEIRERVRASRPEYPIELAYLENMPPTLEEAIASLAQEGALVDHGVPALHGAGRAPQAGPAAHPRRHSRELSAPAHRARVGARGLSRNPRRDRAVDSLEGRVKTASRPSVTESLLEIGLTQFHFLLQIEKPSFQPIEYWGSLAMRLGVLVRVGGLFADSQPSM